MSIKLYNNIVKFSSSLFLNTNNEFNEFIKETYNYYIKALHDNSSYGDFRGQYFLELPYSVLTNSFKNFMMNRLDSYYSEDIEKAKKYYNASEAECLGFSDESFYITITFFDKEDGPPASCSNYMPKIYFGDNAFKKDSDEVVTFNYSYSFREFARLNINLNRKHMNLLNSFGRMYTVISHEITHGLQNLGNSLIRKKKEFKNPFGLRKGDKSFSSGKYIFGNALIFDASGVIFHDFDFSGPDLIKKIFSPDHKEESSFSKVCHPLRPVEFYSRLNEEKITLLYNLRKMIKERLSFELDLSDKDSVADIGSPAFKNNLISLLNYPVYTINARLGFDLKKEISKLKSSIMSSNRLTKNQIVLSIYFSYISLNLRNGFNFTSSIDREESDLQARKNSLSSEEISELESKGIDLDKVIEEYNKYGEDCYSSFVSLMLNFLLELIPTFLGLSELGSSDYETYIKNNIESSKVRDSSHMGKLFHPDYFLEKLDDYIATVMMNSHYKRNIIDGIEEACSLSSISKFLDSVKVELEEKINSGDMDKYLDIYNFNKVFILDYIIYHKILRSSNADWIIEDFGAYNLPSSNEIFSRMGDLTILQSKLSSKRLGIVRSDFKDQFIETLSDCIHHICIKFLRDSKKYLISKA